MQFDNVPNELQETILSLKHGALTIQCDVDDAIEQSDNWEDAKSTIEARMTDLIGEALHVINDIADGNMGLADFKHLAKKMVENGFTKERLLKNDFEGWTYDLVDLLEDDMSIETKVRKEITGEK